MTTLFADDPGLVAKAMVVRSEASKVRPPVLFAVHTLHL